MSLSIRAQSVASLKVKNVFRLARHGAGYCRGDLFSRKKAVFILGKQRCHIREGCVSIRKREICWARGQHFRANGKHLQRVSKQNATICGPIFFCVASCASHQSGVHTKCIDYGFSALPRTRTVLQWERRRNFGQFIQFGAWKVENFAIEIDVGVHEWQTEVNVPNNVEHCEWIGDWNEPYAAVT